MEEKDKYVILFNTSEFQQRILDCITSDEINNFYNNTIFSDDPKCKQAMIHGMILASMMTSKCSYTFTKVIDKCSDDKKSRKEQENKSIPNVLLDDENAKLFINDKLVLDHKKLYPLDVLEALHKEGIINLIYYLR